MSLDRRHGSKGNEESETNAIPAGQQLGAFGEDSSSSVYIPPDSVSVSGRNGDGGGVGGGVESTYVEQADEEGGGGIHSTNAASETTPPSFFDAGTSAKTATTTMGTTAAVTIPAVITTTSENVVYSEALTSVEASQPNTDGVLPMAPRRLPSTDDDDDKEKAVDASPDGR